MKTEGPLRFFLLKTLSLVYFTLVFFDKAFEEIEKVVRMPIVTPTPCLKIRYMHEGFE